MFCFKIALIMKCANLHDICGNVHDVFNLWILRFNKLKKKLVMVGVSAIFWTIWKLGNSTFFIITR